MKKQSISMFENAYFYPDKRQVTHNLRANDLEHYAVERLGESIFGGDLKLKSLISKYYGVNTNNISLIEGGGSNANFHVFYTLLEKGDKVIVEDPSYEPLFCIPKGFDAEVVRFKREWKNKFQPNIEEILSRVDKKTKAIVMTNTHYLSGVKLKEDILKRLIKEAEKKNFYLFFDEVYHDPFIEKELEPIATLTKQGISTYSLSKMYGLSTLRFGLVVANKDVTKEIMRSLFTTEVNNSGLLNKEWTSFFENIKEHAKRSKEIRETNLGLLEDFFNKNKVNYIKPDSGTSCTFKINNINPQKFYDYCIDKFKLKIGYQKQFGDVMFISFGSEPKKFKEGLKIFDKALNEYRKVFK